MSLISIGWLSKSMSTVTSHWSAYCNNCTSATRQVRGCHQLWLLSKQKRLCHLVMGKSQSHYSMYTSDNPQTFVHLYRAIKNESHLQWLIDRIDEYSDQSLINLLQQRYISSTTGEYQYNPLIHSHRWYLADHGNGWLMLWTVSSFVCNIGVTWPNI